MLAVDCILHRDIKRGLCDANGAGSSLDARGFKGFHQLLETFALFATQQVLTVHFETIKRKFVFFHAAITKHFDFAACHPVGREGVGVVAGGLFSKKHRQTFIVRCVRVSARKQRHHMGSCSVGNPGFVACDRIVFSVFDRAGAQRPKVRAGVGFGENGSRQGLGA